MSTPGLIRAAALAAVAALAAGCEEDFDPYNRLQSLRVLAIRSQPAAPAPGETATLEALVYTPEGAPVTYAWRWCPLAGPSTGGYPCLVTEEQLAAAAGGAPVPSLDLGTGPTASLMHGIDPAILRQLCMRGAGPAEGLVDCTGGFPIQVRLTVSSGGDTVEAVTNLRLRFEPSHVPDTNPVVVGITTTAGGVQLIGDDATVTLPRDRPTPIGVIAAGQLADEYPDPEAPGMNRRESLRFAWFIESGDTEDEQTSHSEARMGSTLEAALRNDWTPARREDYARDTSRVFVVVRDNRGGVGWTSGTVRLEATP